MTNKRDTPTESTFATWLTGSVFAAFADCYDELLQLYTPHWSRLVISAEHLTRESVLRWMKIRFGTKPTEHVEGLALLRSFLLSKSTIDGKIEASRLFVITARLSFNGSIIEVMATNASPCVVFDAWFDNFNARPDVIFIDAPPARTPAFSVTAFEWTTWHRPKLLPRLVTLIAQAEGLSFINNFRTRYPHRMVTPFDANKALPLAFTYAIEPEPTGGGVVETTAIKTCSAHWRKKRLINLCNILIAELKQNPAISKARIRKLGLENNLLGTGLPPYHSVIEFLAIWMKQTVIDTANSNWERMIMNLLPVITLPGIWEKITDAQKMLAAMPLLQIEGMADALTPGFATEMFECVGSYGNIVALPRHWTASYEQGVGLIVEARSRGWTMKPSRLRGRLDWQKLVTNAFAFLSSDQLKFGYTNDLPPTLLGWDCVRNGAQLAAAASDLDDYLRLLDWIGKTNTAFRDRDGGWWSGNLMRMLKFKNENAQQAPPL